TGGWYNAEVVEKSISVLTDTLTNLGYAVEVKPKLTLNRIDHTVNITFDIREGAEKYVERVDIVGNVLSKDLYIRKELLLIEGDAFSPWTQKRLERSGRRLRKLNWPVEMTVLPGSEPDKIVMTIEVLTESPFRLELPPALAIPTASASVLLVWFLMT